MELILIHRVRTLPQQKLEPVGAWRVTDDALECFYPPANAQYELRGRKALEERPTESAEAWAHWKAHSSPNWRIWKEYEPASSLFPAETPTRQGGRLRLAYERAHFEFEQSELSDSQLMRGAPNLRAPIANETAADTYNVRGINANSWWLAAELARRHPGLLIHEMHPAGGMYDVLAVFPLSEVSSSQLAHRRVMLNRVGSLQIHTGDEQVVIAKWADLTGPMRRWGVLQLLEQETGWVLRDATPGATPRTLAYRFLATALELMQSDRATWDVRNEFLDSSGYGKNPGNISRFPSAVEQGRAVVRMGILGEPLSHFWTLLRNGAPVAAASIDGTLHLLDGNSIDLMQRYQKHGRRIRWMTVSLLRQWL